MATTLVKIKFDEDLRMVEIPSPPCFSEFVKTVAEVYDLALGGAQSLTFNYKDDDGDEVRFDTDAELELAIRSSPSPLHVTARSSHPRGKTTVPLHYGPSHGPPGHSPPQGSPGHIIPPHGPPGEMPPHGPPGHIPTRGPPGHVPPHGPPGHVPPHGPPGHVPPHGPPGHMPPYGPLGHNHPPAMTSIPSTPGYTEAPYVGPVSSGNEEDEYMIVLDDPREAAAAGAHGSSGKENEDNKNNVTDIDASAAFEAEVAAARDPEGSVMYQKASIRLATQFKVHLTPTQLWRVLTLFRIQGRELVAFGLTPHHALDVNADPSTAGGESDVDVEENKDERAGVTRSKRYTAHTVIANPVHCLLELNGVVIPEDEVHPLLEALCVCPRRLVKMGLLPKEILLEIPDVHRRHRGGPHKYRMHPHRGGHPGRGGAHGRGHRHHPIHAPPPHMHLHGVPYTEGFHHTPPHMHPRGQHGPPHHMASMYASPPPPPHGHFGVHGGAEWYGRHAHCPFSYMWHGPPEMMGGGYGYGHGGWGGWGGHNGGGGGGTPKRGFGKGNKENIAMARFVAHPSGTDVTTVASGQPFKKSWQIRNDSTTTWPEACCLVPVSQSCEDLSSPPEAPVVGDVAPGEEVTVSVDLVAPTQPGMYGGYWRVSDDSQRRFGQRLWAKVMVVGAGENMDAAVEKLSLDDGHRDK